MSQDLIIEGESGVEAYIDALTRVGRREVAGRFTLDEAKARAKLSRYQLVTPHHYVLEFVQAAHLLGATYITARAGGGWFELRFDGAALTAPELGQLWGAAFAAYHDDRERAMRHMAIGVQAALGLNPRQVNIICDSGHERVIFCVEGESAAVVRVEPSQRAGTLVQVRKAINLGVLHQSATAIEGRLPEFMLLRYRCALSEIPVLVNGQRVSAGLRAQDEHDDGCFVRVPIESEWERGWLGIRSPRWPSLVSVMQHGVLVTDHTMPAGPVSVRAVVASRRLSKNLSQSAFVQDEAWHTFMDEVILEAWHEALLRYIEPLLTKEDEAPALGLGSIGRLVLSHVAQLRERGHQVKGATRQLALVIEQLALWRAGDRVGEEAPSWRPSFVSLAQLGVGLTRQRPLAVTRIMFQEVAYEDDRHAMLAVGPDVSLIEAYLGQGAVDVTERLEIKSVRRRNELTWRAQPLFHGALDDAVYPCQVTQTLEHGGFVMVALVARGLSTSALQVYKQGRLLSTRQLSQAPMPRLLFIWSADPEPNERFDGVLHDGDYVEAMLGGVAMVPELIERYVARGDYPDERVWRAMLDGLCDATWWRALLKALGVVEVSAERLAAWRAQQREVDACGWALSEQALARQRGVRGQSRPVAELLAACPQLSKQPYLDRLGHNDSCSLTQVFELHVRLGFIPWVSREHESHAQRLWRVVYHEELKHEVLVLDEPQRQRLANIAPRGALRAYEAELERMVHRQRFMRLRPRQLELMRQDGEFIARRRLHDGLRGELGLCDVILDEGGVWASGGWLEVIVLVSGRLLARRRFRVGFGCFVAVVEAEAISPTLGWDDIIEDEAWREVELSLCEAARALIITKLIAVTRELDAGDVRHLELLWSFIVASQAHRARLWAHDELLGERLERAKLFVVTGQAEVLSYAQVKAQLELQDQLGFVHRREVSRVDEAGWLIVPDELEAAQPLLAQLFWQKRRIYSWGQRVEDHAQLVQARQAYMTRPRFEWRPLGAICTIEEGPDERGRLFHVALFVEEDPRRVGLELSLVCEGREAARRQLRRRWWRVEVMISSLSLIDWELSSALDGEQVRELIARAQSLESRVIARWIEALDEPERCQEDGVEQRWRALWRARFTSVGRMEESRQDDALLSGAWFKTNHGWLRLAELEALHAKSMLCFAWPEDEDAVMSSVIDAHVVILPTRSSLRELTSLFDGRALVSWSEWGDGASEPSFQGELEADGEVWGAEVSRAAHSGMFLDELAALMNRLCGADLAKGDESLWVRCIDWAPLPKRALVAIADGHLSLNSSHEGLQVLSQMRMFEQRGDADWAWCWLLCSVIYTACLMRAEDDGAVRALEFQERLMDHVLAWESP